MVALNDKRRCLHFRHEVTDIAYLQDVEGSREALNRRGAVRLDGFGRAVPLAPGDEWIDAVVDDESAIAGSAAGARVAYAFADGHVLWIVLAEDRRTIRAVARRLL